MLTIITKIFFLGLTYGEVGVTMIILAIIGWVLIRRAEKKLKEKHNGRRKY